jgi:hypothetical protein
MRASGSTRPTIFGFILAIGITLTLPHFVFGVARSFRGSGDSRLLGYTDLLVRFTLAEFQQIIAIESTAAELNGYPGQRMSSN